MIAAADGSGQRALSTLTRPQFLQLERSGMVAGRSNASPPARSKARATLSLAHPSHRHEDRHDQASRRRHLGESAPIGVAARRQRARLRQRAQRFRRAEFAALVPFLSRGEPRRITNDLNLYSGAKITADGSALVTSQATLISRLWVAQAGAAALSRIRRQSHHLRHWPRGWLSRHRLASRWTHSCKPITPAEKLDCPSAIPPEMHRVTCAQQRHQLTSLSLRRFWRVRLRRTERRRRANFSRVARRRHSCSRHHEWHRQRACLLPRWQVDRLSPP